LNQVFEFDHEGRLLMTLGQAKVPGNDSLHFNRPTDVAIGEDGSFYVSDGYGNSRIVKFSSSGKYLFSWGSKGRGEGEFNLPHAIDLDSAGNVFVADRENNRIQVFDRSGKFLRQIRGKGFKNLYSLTIAKGRQQIFATDYLSFFDIWTKGSDIYQMDLSGKTLVKFGRTGNFDGPVSRYHNIVVDRDGNIYVTDILKNGLQKFTINL
jgi:peptidylamidoglycolate lyase